LLVPLDQSETNNPECEPTPSTSEQQTERDKVANEGSDGDEGEESDEDVVDTERDMIEGKTFGEWMTEHVRLLRDFADGLEYQLQFNNRRMLDRLEREGGAFIRFAQGCLSRKRRMNSTRSTSPMTWEKATASAMFYQTRPTPADCDS
jgi:hypothetical protein